MPQQVASGALLQCSFGAAPSALQVLPVNRVMAEGPPAANIMDHKALLNIAPFGMCSSSANPMVAAATAAAMGVLTPMPCLPLTPAPWTPGAATVLIAGMPALDHISQCACVNGGQITITQAATVKTMIP